MLVPAASQCAIWKPKVYMATIIMGTLDDRYLGAMMIFGFHFIQVY